MKRILAMVLATALTVGCASASRTYVQVDTAAVSALSKFKAEKDVRCDAGSIPESSCVAVAKAFVPVWDAYLAVNKLVTAEAPILEVDKAIAELKNAIAGLQDAVNAVEGNGRAILLDILAKALLELEERL